MEIRGSKLIMIPCCKLYNKLLHNEETPSIHMYLLVMLKTYLCLGYSKYSSEGSEARNSPVFLS